MNNKKIGDFGEKTACNYLIKNGYKILNKNYKDGFDEIDAIAISPDGTLVFVEVKTLREGEGGGGGFMPEDQMTLFKLKKISRACQKFAARNPGLIDDEKGWRIDLVAVVLKEGPTGVLHHYRNL